MQNKHQAKVSDVSLCLWMIEREFENNELVYSRSGNTEPVSRIIVDLFDDEYGFSNPVIRYTRRSEVKTLEGILCKHLPQSTLDSGNCNLRVEHGVAVSQYQHIVRRPLMMGLEFFEH